MSERLLSWFNRPVVTQVMAIATVGIVLITFGLAVIYGPSILSSTNAVKEGTNLTGCRSSFSAVVTDKRTAFDIARSDRDSVRAEADTLLFAFARAAVLGQDELVDELNRRVDEVDRRLAAAQEQVDLADSALIEANNVYQEAVELSRRDPEAFLAKCSTAGT